MASSIKVGEAFPSVDVTFETLGPLPAPAADGSCAAPAAFVNASTADFFKGKTVVIFGVPGAFTPTCSAEHLPGYIRHVAAFKAAGVDHIVCASVNDKFVMHSWAETAGVAGTGITMLSDAAGALAKALGLDFHCAPLGGTRMHRCAYIVADNVVKGVFVEPAGAFGITKAEEVLAALKGALTA